MEFARGELFRRLRANRHLSQEDAAHEIGVSVKTLRRWEHDGPIKWANAERAASFYGVPPDDLVTRTADQLDRIEQGVRDVLRRLDELEEELLSARRGASPSERRRCRGNQRPDGHLLGCLQGRASSPVEARLLREVRSGVREPAANDGADRRDRGAERAGRIDAERRQDGEHYGRQRAADAGGLDARMDGFAHSCLLQDTIATEANRS